MSTPIEKVLYTIESFVVKFEKKLSLFINYGFRLSNSESHKL